MTIMLGRSMESKLISKYSKNELCCNLSINSPNYVSSIFLHLEIFKQNLFKGLPFSITQS